MKMPGEVRASQAWRAFRELHAAMPIEDYSPENLERIARLIGVYLEELEK